MLVSGKAPLMVLVSVEAVLEVLALEGAVVMLLVFLEVAWEEKVLLEVLLPLHLLPAMLQGG